MGDQTIYLEKYIENSGVMPPELTRILNTVKDLDERSEDLAGRIQEDFQSIIAAAPAPPGRKGASEVAELRSRLAKDQSLLIQWAEEKLQLANTGQDLVAQQIDMIDADIDALSRELNDEAIGLPDEFDMQFDEPVTNRRTGRLAYNNSVDNLAAMPSMDVGRTTARKAAISLSREQSGFGSEGYVTGSEAWGMEPTPAASKRPAANKRTSAAAAAAAPPATAAPTPQTVQQQQPDTGYQSKRRAAQAAVAATAAAVAALDEDEFVAPPVASTIQMAGLQHASRTPQAPGRLLRYEDIGEYLVGREAEVFWPDEGVWYVVEIKSVNASTREANIIYSTGESEYLNLDDICRDGHMQLMDL